MTTIQDRLATMVRVAVRDLREGVHFFEFGGDVLLEFVALEDPQSEAQPDGTVCREFRGALVGAADKVVSFMATDGSEGYGPKLYIEKKQNLRRPQ